MAYICVFMFLHDINWSENKTDYLLVDLLD